MNKWSNYRITAEASFTIVNNVIPHCSLYIGYSGMSFYFNFLNLEIRIALYWNLNAWDKPNIISILTPSITITEFYSDSTYAYHLDVCWYGLWYRKSFCRINEDNNKYPYTLEQYKEYQKTSSLTFNDFIQKLKELEKKSEDLFSDGTEKEE